MLIHIVLLLVSVSWVSAGYAAGPVSSTAAAPSLTEGTANSFSGDLSGNTRVTLGTLLSCEDQTNSLCRVSGGAVRQTSMGSVTSATSSTPVALPTGIKKFFAQIINATSETKAATATIYGNVINSTTGGIALCTITLPSTATTLQLQDVCPDMNAPYSFYFYTVTVYTSASTAPFTIYAMY